MGYFFDVMVIREMVHKVTIVWTVFNAAFMLRKSSQNVFTNGAYIKEIMFLATRVIYIA